MTRRLGIFGGSFDPIHIGHLVIASDICEQLRLDSVHFVLAPRPPHKRQLVADDTDRIEMLRRAIAHDERFVSDLREFERTGPSYTAQTLESFVRDDPEANLYFLMGEDSLADFPTWHQPQRILHLANLAVACRPGTEIDLARITSRLPEATGRVEMVETPELDISSSMIRDRCKRGMLIRYLVPEKVEHYIIENRLYRAS